MRVAWVMGTHIPPQSSKLEEIFGASEVDIDDILPLIWKAGNAKALPRILTVHICIISIVIIIIRDTTDQHCYFLTSRLYTNSQY